jgi:hypothetical protein
MVNYNNDGYYKQISVDLEVMEDDDDKVQMI